MSEFLRKVWNYNRFERNFTVGDLVKLSFHYSDYEPGESMWVEITEAKGHQPRQEFINQFTQQPDAHPETMNTEFKGILNNTPFGEGLKLGDELEFSLEHIITPYNEKKARALLKWNIERLKKLEEEHINGKEN